MGKNERTSPRVATIASRVLQKPSSATKKDITSLAASVLTQTADKPKSKK